ncbi:MAG: RHS repeat-associated core domain-containing protein [Anaerolineae bacterium]|nr:RHS repeat-associated core domain-containing protein [Anaerolineae bacterium]
MGTGPDHSRYDIYIGRTLWQSFDGYAATPGQHDIPIKLDEEGPHQLEIRNRAERSRAASGTGHVVRFQQLLVPGMTYDYHTIKYHYDALARLIEARYNPGSLANVADGDLLRHYQYTYDLAGNRESQSEALNGGVPVVTNYTYNAANQITNTGFTYDPNGNLTSDGVNSYTWDQTNRLLSTGGSAYQYDGEGRRIQQTVGATVTRYLLDLQPGLAVVLAETTGTNVTRYVHSLLAPHSAAGFPSVSIHAQQNNAGDWNWMMPDGLGSVRGVASDAMTTLESRSYAPYGEPFGLTGTNQTPYGFTGEPLDDNGLLYLRARYYAPGLGVFTALDPFEGMAGRPMSLNGYSWVEGNPAMIVDPSGMQTIPTPPILPPYDISFIPATIGKISEPVVLSPQMEAAIRDALQSATSEEALRAILARYGMVGVAVLAMMPVQQPNGLICNAWDAQLGLCDPVWDNPATYQSFAPALPSFLTQRGWFDIGETSTSHYLPFLLVPMDCVLRHEQRRWENLRLGKFISFLIEMEALKTGQVTAIWMVFQSQ